jgi:Subtilase family
MSPDTRPIPRTFYLNEQHELARAEKEGGGRIPQYVDINWATKGAGIARSISRVRKEIQDSSDPTKGNHCFVLAAPVQQLAKASKDKKKAVEGKVFENTDFAEKHSRVFRRLGLDLINVADDGSAIVHMKPEIMEQLSNTAHSLPELGAKEKSRWATIGRFAMVPPQLRIDSDWLNTLSPRRLTDAVIEFQPLLTRVEIDSLITAIVSILLRNLREAITGIGADFSGRQWVRGQVTRESLEKIAQTFFSVQSLHSPLISIAAGTTPPRQRSRAVPASEVAIDPSTLPVIGVVDTGVPANHSILSRYRRGTYLAPTSAGTAADPHGCFVASRVVFGDVDYSAGPPARTPVGSARYYDVNVSGISPGDIEDKGVYTALLAIVATAPDVRVFNMSFDARDPLDSMVQVKRSEALNVVQDVDNFIFQNDIVVVIAAGNTRNGVIPSTPYPRHFNDPQWALGHWARSFNALTCGSFVGRLSPGGVVTNLEWPSPFCRVGPGLCETPKPDFSADGGNGTPQYQYGPGLGVWGLNPIGLWEDRSGTSYAAPILARECAFALEKLQQVCERGAQPFGVTVKAFLALTATPPITTAPVPELGLRTLGRGRASAQRLEAPLASTGVLIWQGLLEDDQDIARIQIPIPTDWLEEADQPYLRLVVTWDPPVNAAVKHLWATRQLSAKLKMHPDATAHRPSKVIPHGSYPLIERVYNLGKLPEDLSIERRQVVGRNFIRADRGVPSGDDISTSTTSRICR